MLVIDPVTGERKNYVFVQRLLVFMVSRFSMCSEMYLLLLNDLISGLEDRSVLYYDALSHFLHFVQKLGAVPATREDNIKQRLLRPALDSQFQLAHTCALQSFVANVTARVINEPRSSKTSQVDGSVQRATRRA